jgi:hypothetical protein
VVFNQDRAAPGVVLLCADIPHVLHYGLIYKIGDWQYDKHWYFDFDVHKCPPWTGLDGKPKAGIFPPPPYPDKLPNKVLLLVCHGSSLDS